MQKIRVTIWNEFRHEKENPEIAAIYPDGLHRTIAKGIAADRVILEDKSASTHIFRRRYEYRQRHCGG